MRDLKSKYRLFRFRDGSILDISKIDFITNHPTKNDKYTIQISGKQIGLDKDQEAENLIKTWDMYIRLEEQNSEHTYRKE